MLAVAGEGWSIAYEPAAQVMHIQGVSADRHPYRMLFAHHVSMWRFAERTTNGWRRWLLPLVLMGLVVRLGMTMARRALAPKLAAHLAQPIGVGEGSGCGSAGEKGRVASHRLATGPTRRRGAARCQAPEAGRRGPGLMGRYPGRPLWAKPPLPRRSLAPPGWAGAGRTPAGRRTAYYLGLAVLIVLGVLGVYNATHYRDAKVNSAGNTAPTVGQAPPWYQGYAVEACGKLLAYVPTNKDPYGITTKEAGIITISPTVKAAAGKNATLGKFASSIGMTLNAAQLQLPGGHLYQDGQTCEGKPGHVYVMTWSSPQEPAADGVLQNTKSADNTCVPDCNSGRPVAEQLACHHGLLARPAQERDA